MLKHRSSVLAINKVAIDVEGAIVQRLSDLPLLVGVSHDSLEAQGLGRVLEPPDPDNEPDHYQGESPGLAGSELHGLWLWHEDCVVTKGLCGHQERSSPAHFPRL